MPELAEIIHKLSYEVNDEGLNRATTSILRNIDTVALQTKQYERLQRIYNSYSKDEVDKRQRVSALMDKQRLSVRALANETERSMITNRKVVDAMRQEMGIIGSLEARLDLLAKARRRATTNADIKFYDNEIKRVRRELEGLNNVSNNSGARGGGLLREILGGVGISAPTAGIAAVATGLGVLAKKSTSAAISMESLERAFANLLGGSDKARSLLLDLSDFAGKTPFALNELTEYTKQLLAFGFAQEEIIPTLRMLGDVAGGVGAEKLPQIVYAFSQIRTNGKLMAQDLLQLTNVGFNPLQIIAEKTGRTVTELRKDMEDGLITFEKVQEAFEIATSEGGRFHNMMQSQSETTSGAISNMGDEWDRLLIALGRGNTGIVRNTVIALSGILQTFREWVSLSPVEEIRQEQLALNSLVRAIVDVNNSGETRSMLIDKLKREYPDFLSNIDAEAASNEYLLGKLKLVNSEYERKLRLAQSQQRFDTIDEQRQDVFQKKINYELFRGAIKIATGREFEDLSESERFELFNERTWYGTEVSDLGKLLIRQGEKLTGKSYGTFGAKGDYQIEQIFNRLKKEFEEVSGEIDLLDKQWGDALQDKDTDKSLLDEKKNLQIQIAETEAEIRKLEDARQVPSYLRLGVDVNKKLEAEKRILAELKIEYDKLTKSAEDATSKYQAYFDKLIKKESGGVANAKNPNSSATGLGQFTEGTWSGLMGRYPKAGLTLSGRTNPEQAKKALELFTEENANYLKKNGIEPNEKNLYLAHFLGPAGAVKLIKKMGEDPSFSAAELLPNAASANIPIFYKGSKKTSPRSASELYELQTKGFVGDSNFFIDEVQRRKQSSLKIPEDSRTPEETIRDTEFKPFFDVGEFKRQKRLHEEWKKMEDDIDKAKKKHADWRDEVDEKSYNEEIVRIQSKVDAYTYGFQSITNSAVQMFDTINRAQINALEQEIRVREQRVTYAIELARMGNVEILNMEQSRLEDAYKKRSEYARREQTLNAALVLSNSLVAVAKAVANAQSGDPYSQSARTVAAVVAVLGALVAGYAAVRTASSDNSFADGVVDYKGKGGARDDMNNVWISNGESVITADGTQKNKPWLKAINRGMVISDIIEKTNSYHTSLSYPFTIGQVASKKEFKALEGKMDKVVDALYDTQISVKNVIDRYGIATETSKAIREEKRKFLT